ncbi:MULTISPECIES: PHB depolymerase family esterase [unclassified Ruegeria]|uniref:alpha/beta hydrolase family esterase n=1 Tax=unclassified Ruegeria TaxID=2625375 RepID=UPI0014885E88|nr:PHB depolymerase family esterase [Ruegeria sp. HKCCD8929]
MIYRLICIFLLTASPALAVDTCHGDTACQLGDRSYHILEPDGWDGETPLPVLLHFHGWARQGNVVVNHTRIAGATRRRGVLLVAPNGRHRSWDFWTSETDDVEFANRVLTDVAKRYPVDPQRTYVSGYSYGSAMAWRYACQSGNSAAALLAIAGTLSQTEACPQGPAEVRHVHGLDDTVMDFPFGPGADTTYPVALWREKYGCADPTPGGDWQAKPFLTLTRTEWTDCAAGKVTLDVHPGGHFIPHGWIARQLDELLGLTPSYP